MSISAITKREFRLIPINDIQETVVQIRIDYPEEPLLELSNSLETEGQLQPILVAHAEQDKFELIIGSRRLRAARQGGIPEIPALVIEADSPLNYLLIALSENLHREDLNFFEEAHAFLRLMKDYGLGVKEIAQRTHKSDHYVRSRMELLGMPDEVQALVAQKRLPLESIGVLAKLPTGEEQTYYANKTVSSRLSKAELRQLITSDAEEEAPRNKRDVSADKVRVRIDMFTRWMKRLSRNKNFSGSLNADERSAIARSIQAAQTELQGAASVFGTWSKLPSTHVAPPRSKFVDDPDNHGDEWSLRHIDKITASDRPSDEVLAVELGRTVGAIRAMRSKMQSEKKAHVSG